MSVSTRGTPPTSRLLRRAASGAFVATMAHGVPATHRSASATRSLPEDWAAVADAFDAFVDFAAKSRALSGGGPAALGAVGRDAEPRARRPGV